MDGSEERLGTDAPWGDDLGLASVLGDGIVVLAPGGTIVWANQAFATIVGRPLDDVVGSDGLAIVHPEELARALDGIVFVAQFPGRTSVAPYRIRHGDGSWLHVELKAATIRRGGVEHLAMAVRDGTSRELVNRALESVANGEPLERTADLVAEVVTRRWSGTAAVLSLGTLDGERQVFGNRLPELLFDHATGRLGDLGEGPPWELCGDGKVAVVDAADLSPRLEAAAVAAGFLGFAVASVEDPGGAPGCLLVWFDHTAIAHLEFTHAAAELTELLGLALERRLHLWQLWYVARHDSLTQVFNRSGFLERFELDVVAARAGGPDGPMATVVLYIDLDGLKAVNDRDGHAAGDRVLIDAAARLVAAVGPEAVVARLGGDEFVVSATFAPGDAEARSAALAEAVVHSLRFPVPSPADGLVGRPGIVAAASVGVVVDDGLASPARLLERADAAMYRAKSAGRSRWSR